MQKSMEVPLRILNPSYRNLNLNLNRQISTKFNPKSHYLSLNPTLKSPFHNPLSSKPFKNPIFNPPKFSTSSQLGFFLSLSNSQFHPNSHPNNGDFFQWHKASTPVTGVPSAGGKPQVAAVILGWLGATPKHLRRYAEMYTSKGIDAITFVVPVKDVLWFDLGKKVENRIRNLADELVSWLSKAEGRERSLIFHTFSTTGWLVYGSILIHLQDRPDLLEKIKGCIVDSGGDPELNPKVWAAGFSAALLKKRNTSMVPSSENVEPSIDKNKSTVQDKDPLIVEAIVFSALENLFSFLFKLPAVSQKLWKIIHHLSENQPPCPQLYLYSAADKVIPYRSVESYIEHQKLKGRDVQSYNFGSSPHVDHYRAFPDVYTSQVNNFYKTHFR